MSLVQSQLSAVSVVGWHQYITSPYLEGLSSSCRARRVICYTCSFTRKFFEILNLIMYRIVPSTLSHGYKHSIIFKNGAAYLSFHVIFKFVRILN